VLFRSDRLDRLSDADLARIAQLQPSLIVDLRTDRERRRGADRVPPAAEHLVADVYADADVPEGVDPLAQVTTRADAVAFLVSANRKFVSMASARAAYGSLFAHIRTAPGPVVYHCTAGKDRTGWATAVLLTILGVPRSVIMEDYLASNDYLAETNRRRFERPGADRERLEPVYSVSAAYLDAAFQEAAAAYGSFDHYLEQALGLDQKAIAALRDRYLVGDPIL
jgi:protein-tyrosine phosphatase